MFSFLTPYLAAIKVGLAVMAISAIGVLYWKWEDMKTTIATQQANIVVMDNAVKANAIVMADIKKNEQIRDQLLAGYSTELTQSQARIDALQSALHKLNITVNITKDPIQTELNANDIFNRTLACLSSSTGSALSCVK